jgi:hypothetical protein
LPTEMIRMHFARLFSHLCLQVAGRWIGRREFGELACLARLQTLGPGKAGQGTGSGQPSCKCFSDRQCPI